MHKASALAVALVMMTGSGAHARPRFQASVGTEWSKGRYGEDVATTIIDSPVSLKVRTGRWAFTASTSHVLVDGPAEIAAVEGGDLGGVTDPRDGRPRQRQSGIGDTVLGSTYTLDDVAGSPAYLAFGARVRLPTGSFRKGLGVGATDYLLSTEAGLALPRGGASAKLTRRVLGDTEGYARRNGWQVEAGAWILPSTRLQLGADYEHRDSAFRRGTALQQADVYASYALSSRFRLQVTGSLGLSRTAADRALSATLVARF